MVIYDFLQKYSLWDRKARPRFGIFAIMEIRKAAPDDARAIARLMMMAMGEIVYAFIGERDASKGERFLADLVGRPENQYSYENAWTMVDDKGAIAACAVVYDGAHLDRLKEPVMAVLEERYGRLPDAAPETGAGELYIDTLAVDPAYRGQGLGSRLLSFLLDEWTEGKGRTFGLLVDRSNPGARRLYERLGFVVVGHTPFMGQDHDHMQRPPGL